MGSPLVRTKLYAPRPRADQVVRTRLVDRLGAGPGPRLSLVSAPAGFGKTTVLAGWVEAAAAAGRPVAWVSLDETEQQPDSFWTYVAHAVEAASPGAGSAALLLLEAAHPSIPTVLATLVNDLGSVPGGLDLVLDDYHLADGPGIADDVSFLVDHLPPGVRLVIATRADPSIPLGRLRARGELMEVRVADLRFRAEEVSAYLDSVAGLRLQPGDITTLEERTEGWVAALQLAALSLQGRADASEFIAGFAGDDRYVVDYLVEEVLARQPDDVRRFLLETSILERMTGSLCDAVTGGADGSAVLELLDRSNLFVVALDDRRHWYRYHHLFADVLRAHLLQGGPDAVADLHRRAAQWCASHDEPVAAVRHALAAGDVEDAADLVERSVIGLLRERREAQALRWIDDLPRDVVRRRPVLAVGFIGALMSGGRFDTVPARLDDVERLLANQPEDMVVLDASELARLPGAIQTYRAALALVGGDPVTTVRHADLAIERAAPGDDLTLSAAGALSGLARWTVGDLDAAHDGYAVAVEGLRRAGHHSDVLGCSITLADLRITQGRLSDARRAYEEALRLAAEHPGAPLRGTVDMVVGLSQVALERGHLDEAAAHLERADELGEHNGLPQHPYRWRVARARMHEVLGDPSRAAVLLEEAERVYVGDFSPNVRPVAAQRARILLALGRLAEAGEWARAQRLAPDDELSYLREYEHVTLARLLLQQHSTGTSEQALRAATVLLERLDVAARAGGRTGSLIEILVLRALAHHARHGRHDLPGALLPLGEALELAEPEGFEQVFVGEGAPMATLLAAASRANPSWDHPRHLAGAFERPRRPSGGAQQGLVDPLSARELEVLRLLATDLGGPALADELVVSLNTLRTHTRKIYAKLGVNNRREAVSRAADLGLVARR